ncbi:hypothetical protein J4E80_010961 [Alternaria sp. BMP 0032]|nr:hypothetical protein J4E80_010961 [Alternaria sp. BMP 0032]
MVLTSIERAPLNQRAWASQERQLSRRILHFTDTQIFWECCEKYSSEVYPDGLPLWAQANWTVDATKLKTELSHIISQSANDTSDPSNSYDTDRMMDEDTYLEWLTYRDQYSGLALTNPNDKLVAIHGITKWVTEVTGELIVAGLCRDHIEEDLCWDEDKARRRLQPNTAPTGWRAPTWSWAHTNSPVRLSQLTKWHMEHDSRQIEVKVVKGHVTGKISGELESATIELKCKPVPATFTEVRVISPRNIVLRLFDQNEDAARRKSTHRFRRADMQQFTDLFQRESAKARMKPRDERSITHGYVVLIQCCLHDPNPAKHQDSDDSETEEGTEHETKDEEMARYRRRTRDERRPYEKNSAEALFLEARDNNTFVRAGLLRFERDRGVKRMLEAHRLAEERVITLI